MAVNDLVGQRGEDLRNQSPFKRVAKPIEVAYPVMFLASEGAEWSTGAIIDANGASYLRT
jgi:NAD(P)-dependent dehydrogenase (short-subunit alcohol dehydrogenase family)